MLTPNVAELDDDEVKQSKTANEVSERYETLDSMSQSQATIDEITEGQRAGSSPAALKQSESYARRLKSYLKEKALPDEIETMNVATLNQHLRSFYSDLRNGKGEYLSPVTLVCIRAALQRYLSSPPVSMPIDIIRDKEFAAANHMFKLVCAKYSQNGGTTKAYAVIQASDMRKLALYFDRSGPQRLQEEVAFSILYYFGDRGREALHQLTRNSFEFNVDSSGEWFYRLIDVPNVTSTREQRVNRTTSDSSKHRMYGSPCDPDHCPVVAMTTYLESLPASHSVPNCLFPVAYARPNIRGEWYTLKQQRGVNWLGDLMRRLSMAAGLSKVYSNRCVKATVATNLDESELLDDDIMLTGQSPDCCKRTAGEHVIKAASKTLCKRMRFGDNHMYRLDEPSTSGSVSQAAESSLAEPRGTGSDVVASPTPSRSRCSESDRPASVGLRAEDTSVPGSRKACVTGIISDFDLSVLSSLTGSTFTNCTFNFYNS